MGIEPMHAGATIQCVNRFTKAAIKTSNALSSQSVSRQVLSAYECLTTVFGMGTGGTTQLSSLDILLNVCTFKTIQKKLRCSCYELFRTGSLCLFSFSRNVKFTS